LSPAREAAVDVTVVTVTHNGRASALQTLESARAAIGRISVEWIVVDNASSDGTPDAIAARFPDVDVRRRPNRGFAAGNNAGIVGARGRYVLLLNPDVEFNVGTLEQLVQAMDDRPGVGAGGVIQRASTGEVFPSAWRFPSAARQWGEALGARRWPLFRALQEADVDEAIYWTEHDVDWITGSFLIVRREAIADAGLLDERFFLYGEETDWCLRIRLHGWAIRHIPTIEVTHHHGNGVQPHLMMHLARSKRLYAEKHFGRAERASYLAALNVRHGMRALVFGCLSRATGRRHVVRYRAELAALRAVRGR
jgi:GT2 family glycosyltransferase